MASRQDQTPVEIAIVKTAIVKTAIEIAQLTITMACNDNL
jgi:hypothetical protein